MIERSISRSFFFSIFAHMTFLGLFVFSFQQHLSSEKTSLTFLGSIVGKYEFAKLGVAQTPASLQRIPPTVGSADIRQTASGPRDSGAKKPAASIGSDKEIIKQPVIDAETLRPVKPAEKGGEEAPAFRAREPLKL